MSLLGVNNDNNNNNNNFGAVMSPQKVHADLKRFKQELNNYNIAPRACKKMLGGGAVVHCPGRSPK